MGFKVSVPGEIQHQFHNDMIAVLRKHGGALRADEMLALAAYSVGQIMAMQDQRTMTPAMAIELVRANIEAGNAHAVDGLMSPAGKA